jgi:oxalate decarboxylase/phosphoglucose isomerase-like protein (cupin superfamily)
MSVNRNLCQRLWVLAVFGVFACAMVVTASDSLQTARPFVKHLPADTVHYVPLLEPPVSRALESGCVSHAPGKSGHEHSTQSYEEMLVVLRGQGKVVIAGRDSLTIQAGDIAYIPPHTTHLVRCTGDVPLQYVYIATDTEAKP